MKNLFLKIACVVVAVLVAYVAERQKAADFRLLVAAAYVGLGATWHAGPSGSCWSTLAVRAGPVITVPVQPAGDATFYHTHGGGYTENSWHPSASPNQVKYYGWGPPAYVEYFTAYLQFSLASVTEPTGGASGRSRAACATNARRSASAG